MYAILLVLAITFEILWITWIHRIWPAPRHVAAQLLTSESDGNGDAVMPVATPGPRELEISIIYIYIDMYL